MLTLTIVAVSSVSAGCNGNFGGDRIREMEYRLDGGVATFVIPQHDWLDPFGRPTVTEFAVATPDDDEQVVWRLAAEDEAGVPARGLAITFGIPPAGMKQVAPDETLRPRPLVPGRNYYVAAGGPTNVYRVIFALPVSDRQPIETPTTAPADPSFPRQDMWDRMRQTSQPAEAAPVEDPTMQPEPPETPMEDDPPVEEPETPQRPSIFGE